MKSASQLYEGSFCTISFISHTQWLTSLRKYGLPRYAKSYKLSLSLNLRFAVAPLKRAVSFENLCEQIILYLMKVWLLVQTGKVVLTQREMQLFFRCVLSTRKRRPSKTVHCTCTCFASNVIQPLSYQHFSRLPHPSCPFQRVSYSLCASQVVWVICIYTHVMQGLSMSAVTKYSTAPCKQLYYTTCANR